jgi:hypothetical protein
MGTGRWSVPGCIPTQERGDANNSATQLDPAEPYRFDALRIDNEAH